MEFFQSGEPDGVGMASGQQPVALRHCGVVGGDFTRVAGFQCPDQAVQEAAAAGQAFLEQPVHLWREPHRGDVGGDFGLAARRGAVQTEHPPVRGAIGESSRPDVGLTLRSRKPPRDGPATGPAMPRKIGVS